MEWLDYMNASLDYIEENLSIKLDPEKIAAKAGCSSYNFQRMFSFIADISLAAYIRRRCMTAAALELANTNARVIDTAMKYGYDSPVSFARAFHLVHGITPQEARVPGAHLVLFPRISFQLSVKGAKNMKYRIENLGEFELAGVSREISTKDGKNFKDVPQMWEDVCSDGTGEMIFGMNGNSEEEMYGVCYAFEFDKEKFRYLIAVNPEKEVPESCEILKVPAATWVKFECEGVAGIQDTFKRMYMEWFPKSGYEHADGPEIEFYPIGAMDSPDYKAEVWIPIQPKKK